MSNPRIEIAAVMAGDAAEVAAWEAFLGGAPMSWLICSACNGSGLGYGSAYTCRHCGGSGEVRS